MPDKSKKIIITFDKPLTTMTGKEGGGYGTSDVKHSNNKITAASGVAGGAKENAIDGSISTYWGDTSALPNWLSFDLTQVRPIYKVRFYVVSSIPKDFKIQGSNDNSIWNDVYTGQCTNTVSAWQTFTFTPASYRYWRVYVTTRWSSYTYIYEVELYEQRTIGNERAFTVTAPQYDTLGTPGVLSTKTYMVEEVQSIDDRNIALIIDPFSRFNNSEGNITVSYNAALGNIAGPDGAVISFSEQFTPLDLIRTISKWDLDNLNSTLIINIVVSFITYRTAYSDNLSINSGAYFTSSVVVTKTGQNPL